MVRSLLVVALLAMLASSASAVEPWADPKLTVHTGLQVWLDASRATGKEPTPADHKLSKWSDASGHGRYLEQANVEARPTRLPNGTICRRTVRWYR